MADASAPKTTASVRYGTAGRFVRGNPSRGCDASRAALLALDTIGGDMRAAEILLSRPWPQRKSRPVTLDPPALNMAANVSAALAATAAAMAEGTLSPKEAGAVAGMIETQRRAIKTQELEARIAAVKARSNP